MAQTAANAQDDPLYRGKGDQHRHYWFAAAQKESFYRAYVPNNWSATAAWPLIIILHGANGDENTAFDRAPEAQKGLLTRLAEQRGYILVAVNGLGAAYGNQLYMPKLAPAVQAAAPGTNSAPAPAPNAAWQARDSRDPLLTTHARLQAEASDPVLNGLSEQDVTNVMLRMVAEYNVDRSRIYLMGNSMGSLGTFYLASKYPQAWRAIVPSDGPPEPSEYPFERLNVKGALIIGGDQDRIADPRIMQALQAGIQAHGIEARYYNVPGGTHSTAWYMALPRIFDFYDEMGRK